MSCPGLDSARDIIIPSDETRCIEEEAFLIFLYRMAKHIDLVTIEQEFGRDNTTLGRIVSHMIHVLVSINHYLVSDNIDFFVPHLKIYNKAIRRKFRNGNMPVPAADTAMFLDGTSLQIARG